MGPHSDVEISSRVQENVQVGLAKPAAVAGVENGGALGQQPGSGSLGGN